MSYEGESIEGRLLRQDPVALAQVARWIAIVITSARFLRLRDEWPDLHQEAVVRVFESLRSSRFDPARDFRSYVQALARYTAMESLARRRRQERAAAAGPPLEEGRKSPEEAVISTDLIGRVLALATDDCRRLFRMYFLEQKDYTEIAARVGTPVGTVKSRLFRCLKSAHRGLGRLGRA